MLDEAQVKQLFDRVGALEHDQRFAYHQHTGTDSVRVMYDNLAQRKLWKDHTLFGATAATAANYGVFFTAPVACYVTGFRESHQAPGTDASPVTLTLEKLPTATAADAGTVLLTTALSLKATADVVQTGTLVTSNASLNLLANERLCLKDVGNLADVAGVTVLVEITIV